MAERSGTTRPTRDAHQSAALFETDEVDLRILAELEADGRQSYSTIAKTVGMSEGGVRLRVHRLREAGILEIHATVHPEHLGLKCHATVGIRVTGSSTPVVTALQQLPQVCQIKVTTGSFDLLVDLLCRDETETIRLVAGTVRDIPGVTVTETFFYWSAYRSAGTAERVCEDDPAHAARAS